MSQDEPDPGLDLYLSPIRPELVLWLLLEKCLRPTKLGERFVLAATEKARLVEISYRPVQNDSRVVRCQLGGSAKWLIVALMVRPQATATVRVSGSSM